MMRLLMVGALLACPGYGQAPPELESAKRAYPLRIQGLQNQYRARVGEILKQYGAYLSTLGEHYRASGLQAGARAIVQKELARFQLEQTLQKHHFQQQPPDLAVIQARVITALNRVYQFEKERLVGSQDAYVKKLDLLLEEYADTKEADFFDAVKAEMIRLRPGRQWSGDVSGAAIPSAFPEGLVLAHFTFDAVNADQFANRAHPTKPARNVYARFEPEGRKGGACYMPKETQSYVELQPFALGTPFTVSCWVQFEQLDKPQKIWSFGNGEDREAIELSVAAKGLMLVHNHKSVRKFTRSASTYETGRWYHLAVTMDEAGRATVYRDGKPLVEKAGQVIDAITREKMYIGRGSFQDMFFAGLVDDFMVMKQALSADGLHDLYESY
jgi:hypothetical protein